MSAEAGLEEGSMWSTNLRWVGNFPCRGQEAPQRALPTWCEYWEALSTRQAWRWIHARLDAYEAE